jgi:hypothetical protein
MSVTATNPTVGTIDGTPVVFYPVPTPWPLSAGCENYIYRQLAGTILAWDPVYPLIFETAAQSWYDNRYRVRWKK